VVEHFRPLASQHRPQGGDSVYFQNHCVRWYKVTHSQVGVETEFGVVSLILLVYTFYLR